MDWLLFVPLAWLALNFAVLPLLGWRWAKYRGRR